MRWKFLATVLLYALLFMFIAPGAASADDECTTTWVDPPGEAVITCSGGGGGGGGGEACTPGTVNMQWVLVENRGDFCLFNWVIFDQCTGEIFYQDPRLVPGSCPPAVDPPENPCTTFEIGPGGVYCNSSAWRVQARVSFPEVYLDVRPFPASLVRWPTALRTLLQPNSGSGSLSYYSPSGCSLSSPCVGDLANITLTLSLRPVGTTHVHIPQLGEYETRGNSAYCRSTNRIILAQGNPTKNYCWEVPSHPAAGGGPLAGTISGLDELPGDMPVFVGYGRAPYHLFWDLSYFEYIRYCDGGSCDGANVPGRNSWRWNNGTSAWERYCNTSIPSGTPGNCTVYVPPTGTWRYTWDPHNQGGEILPSQVQGLPPSLAADLDGNGVPDAYWNNNLTLRRMDDYDRVGTSAWGRSWNWGGTIYWGVREGQAQIGWPGVP